MFNSDLGGGAFLSIPLWLYTFDTLLAFQMVDEV